MLRKRTLADQSTKPTGRLANAVATGQAAVRATAQWTLCFAISFAVMASVLILAHV
jgi:hypothetical protein